jgi:predicted DCC family thiol-disulfide oxidoreductase YuxK
MKRLPDSALIEVWIDGECAVCRRSRRWCADRDPDRRIRFVDLHDETDIRPPADQTDLMHRVHVRRADGSIAVGFEGWRAVLGELPGWRWLATASGWPPLSWVGRLGYALVARWRHLIPGQ